MTQMPTFLDLYNEKCKEVEALKEENKKYKILELAFFDAICLINDALEIGKTEVELRVEYLKDAQENYRQNPSSGKGDYMKIEMFPIMQGVDIPWSMIKPFENNALNNHGQSLERLAQRGGLAPSEAIAIIKGFSLRQVVCNSKTKHEHVAELAQMYIDELNKQLAKQATQNDN